VEDEEHQGESTQMEPDRNESDHGKSERLQRQKAKKKQKDQEWKDKKRSKWLVHKQENARHRLMLMQGRGCAFEDCVRGQEGCSIVRIARSCAIVAVGRLEDPPQGQVINISLWICGVFDRSNTRTRGGTGCVGGGVELVE
jgi:hypothetical protein